MQIKTKDVITYVTLPQVLPRLRQMFANGFSYISFLMAHIYFMARILPRSHPYLMHENLGRFGVINVISEARRHLVFSRKNLDQIFIFVVMLIGIVMLFAQLFLLVYSTLIAPAMAFSFFDTPNPDQDIAFNVLDQVFGIPDLFCSITTPANCTSYSADPNFDGTAGPALPMPFHVALHELFRYYSTGLLMIAVLLFLYFLVVVLLETATSGTPFGKRFQNVWVPIRLVVALGLLMPIHYGLNAGQYIVLYTAKYGGGFATTGWSAFLNGVTSHDIFSSGSVSSTGTGERYNYLIIPEPPNFSGLLEAMSLIHTCAYAYHYKDSGLENKTDPTAADYEDMHANYAESTSDIAKYKIQPFLVKQPTSAMVAEDGNALPGVAAVTGNADKHMILQSGTSYLDALGFYYGANILIRFGERAVKADGTELKYKEELGGVKPLCGEIVVPISDLKNAGTGGTNGGADAMQQFYFEWVKKLWFDEEPMRQFARGFVAGRVVTNDTLKDQFCDMDDADGAGMIVNASFTGAVPTAAACKIDPHPNLTWQDTLYSQYAVDLENEIREAWTKYVENSLDIGVDSLLKSYGWGGAGIWYSRIAEVNSGWVDGVAGVPRLRVYPLVMEEIRAARKKHNDDFDFVNQFNLVLSAKSKTGVERIELSGGYAGLERVATALSDAFIHWNANPDNKNADGTGMKKAEWHNAFRDAINILLGTNGLLNIRGANQHIHPLAQLVGLGKGMVNSAVLNMAASSGTQLLGGFVGALGKYGKSAKALNAASEMFFGVAFMGLTAGVLLFYVLPFLPFLYFFFAVASWVKTIFEAMVGVPLWALAHMRIDGEGLPGEAAQNGYYLILEIFLRPIMTVIALIAAITVFAAQVRILNLIWDLVTVNASGFAPSTADILSMENDVDVFLTRTQVDQFFFLMIYTVVCYMMANASFKLIDKIPDNIMRWVGGSVSSYGDIDQENIEKLNQYATSGALTVGQQAAGAIRETAGNAGGALGSVFSGKGQGGKAGG